MLCRAFLGTARVLRSGIQWRVERIGTQEQKSMDKHRRTQRKRRDREARIGTRTLSPEGMSGDEFSFINIVQVFFPVFRDYIKNHLLHAALVTARAHSEKDVIDFVGRVKIFL